MGAIVHNQPVKDDGNYVRNKWISEYLGQRRPQYKRPCYL